MKTTYQDKILFYAEDYLLRKWDHDNPFPTYKMSDKQKIERSMKTRSEFFSCNVVGIAFAGDGNIDLKYDHIDEYSELFAPTERNREYNDNAWMSDHYINDDLGRNEHRLMAMLFYAAMLDYEYGRD